MINACRKKVENSGEEPSHKYTEWLIVNIKFLFNWFLVICNQPIVLIIVLTACWFGTVIFVSLQQIACQKIHRR
jgi:hypothetical protein